jgi:hypothetical protein
MTLDQVRSLVSRLARDRAVFSTLLLASSVGILAPRAPAQESRALRSLGNLPVSFIENQGQVDAQVRYVARRGGMTAYFTRDAFVLQLVRKEGRARFAHQSRRAPSHPACAETITGANVFLSFEGASDEVAMEGVDILPGHFNYFLGNDPARWRANVPGYSSIRYRGLYRGIDVVVKEHRGHLEYDLILEPGADLDRVAIRCEGAEHLRLDNRGALIIETTAGPSSNGSPTRTRSRARASGSPWTARSAFWVTCASASRSRDVEKSFRSSWIPAWCRPRSSADSTGMGPPPSRWILAARPS